MNKSKKQLQQPKEDKKQPEKPKLRSEMSEAFGLWADRKIDSLEYEQEIRKEWETK